MINLLYTVNGLRVNGVSAVIMHYISGLDKSEYNISLFTDEIEPQFISELNDNGVEVITSCNRKKNQFLYFRELISVLKKGDYDIIHVHGNSATIALELIAAKMCGIPARVAHSHNTTCTHKIIDKLMRPLLYHTYTHGIGCGEEAGKWMFSNHPYFVMPNGVDLEHFSFNCMDRDEIRQKLGIDNKFVIGHIGRFTEQKNHEFILDIFEEFIKINKNAVLLFVGNGPKECEIKKIAKTKNLEDKIIFFGVTSDTAKMYSAMDIFLFPSKFEGVPLTLVEAQANGLMCVISNTISQEVVKTDLINILPLGQINYWVDKLGISTIDRDNASRIAIDQLTEAGFNINSVIPRLNRFYHEITGQ